MNTETIFIYIFYLIIVRLSFCLTSVKTETIFISIFYLTILIFLFDLSHRRVMDKLFIQLTFSFPKTTNIILILLTMLSFLSFLFVCKLSTNNIVSNVLKSNNYKPLILQEHSLHFTCLGEKNVNKRILWF
jgi:hypothetical protein